MPLDPRSPEMRRSARVTGRPAIFFTPENRVYGRNLCADGSDLCAKVKVQNDTFCSIFVHNTQQMYNKYSI